MTLEEFMKKALMPTPGQRKGQLFANTLQSYRPKLMSHLIDEKLDPFYDDRKLWSAVGCVTANWDVAEFRDE
jgi:hypothetical protein